MVCSAFWYSRKALRGKRNDAKKENFGLDAGYQTPARQEDADKVHQSWEAICAIHQRNPADAGWEKMSLCVKRTNLKIQSEAAFVRDVKAQLRKIDDGEFPAQVLISTSFNSLYPSTPTWRPNGLKYCTPSSASTRKPFVNWQNSSNCRDAKSQLRFVRLQT